MTIKSYKEKPAYAVIGALTILICSVMAVIFMYEFISVAVFGNYESYPFGNEGENPYYYKTMDLYSTVNLTWGILYLIFLGYAVDGLIEKRKKILIFTFVASILIGILIYIHGNIGGG